MKNLNRRELRYLVLLIFNLVVSMLIVILSFKSCAVENNDPTVIVRTDTLVIVRVDTINVTKERIKEREKIVHITDTLYITDTVVYGVQKQYEDSFSTIYYSGVDPTIDSLTYRIPEKTVVIENEKVVMKKQKIGLVLSVSPQIGYGMCVEDKNVRGTPYIGVGVGLGFGWMIK